MDRVETSSKQDIQNLPPFPQPLIESNRNPDKNLNKEKPED
jgi:hypothetical protein